MENNTTKKAIWNTSFCNVTISVADIAKTMDDAPRSPDQDTSIIWLNFALKGDIMANTLTGLDINVKKTAINIAGIHTFTNEEGFEAFPAGRI